MTPDSFTSDAQPPRRGQPAVKAAGPPIHPLPSGKRSNSPLPEPVGMDEVEADKAEAIAARPGFLRRGLLGITDCWDQRRTPALLVSVIVHTLLLLLLALFTVATQLGAGDAFRFTASILSAPEDQPLSTLVIDGDDSSATSAPVVEPSETQVSQPQAGSDSAEVVAELLKLGSTAPPPAQAEAQNEFQQILAASSSQLQAAFVSSGISSRRPDQRQRRAMQFGATAQSEQAVENALAWLAAHQLPSGAWSLVHDAGPCNGRCANPGSKERFDPAATGLALLAFMGAGYTHESGKYQDTVNRGVYFLYQIMEETHEGGSFLYTSDRGMYNHGIAAFALCEAYQMTLDKDLEKAAQLAVDFIVSAQNYAGGWGYLPGKPGDLTISGWQVMALKSAHSAGLYIPGPVTFKLDGFLKTQRLEGTHFFGYGKPDKSPTCTAIGQMIRLFRGAGTTDGSVLDAATYLKGIGTSQTDVYFNYYVSLFLFHIGGPLWEDWNTPVREYLIKTQATSGHEAGSWYFENPYGKEGGRLYTTAMAAMTLEVYYRFSPLYNQTDVKFEL